MNVAKQAEKTMDGRSHTDHREFIVTPTARAALSDDDINVAFQFHEFGDWGELYECDHERYDALMRDDVTFLSVFEGGEEGVVEFWVITKKDGTRTILLPHEY